MAASERSSRLPRLYYENLDLLRLPDLLVPVYHNPCWCSVVHYKGFARRAPNDELNCRAGLQR